MSRPWDRADLSEAGTVLDAQSLLLERFDYLSKQRSPVLLSLAVRMPIELPRQARPVLIVEREAVEQFFSARLVSTSDFRSGGEGEWLWRGVFGVPSQLLVQPQAAFAVRFLDDLVLPLPAPASRRAGMQRMAPSSGRPRTWPYAVRRGALLLIVTCQLCVLPGFSTGGALADGPIETPTKVEPVIGPSTQPGDEAPAKPEGTPEPQTPAGPVGGSSGEGPPPATGGGEAPPKAAPQTPLEVPSNPPHEQGSNASSQMSNQPDPAPSTPAGSSSAAPAQRSSEVAPVAPSVNGWSSQRVHGPKKLDANRPDGPPRTAAGERGREAAAKKSKPPANGSTDDTSGSGPEPVVSSVPMFEGIPAGLAGVTGVSGLGGDQPPAYLIPIYKQAGHRYHVPWSVLAAINQLETDYGQNLSVSSAGALGWMQFMPATWQQWGVDADRDGYANPYSPQDAIFAAARYLQASGAERDLARAIFAYNHADWYVAEVLLRAHTLDNATFAPIEKGYSLPLAAPYMQQLGRTDDGVDIETAPDGALVYSITPGVVTAVASDPAGFGPNYPVIEASGGSLAGQHIYYGHVAQSLVQPGQHVAAGQPIAIIGHTGDAAALGHGHIEIGFSDAGGAPVDQHGAEAWTPAGSVMRAFLVELSAAFGIRTS
jgi:murein DD-endopeptidase MepM/ murein hydrolase activator NlpD